MLYACDGRWWIDKRPGYGQDALERFKGLKVSQHALACKDFGLNRIRFARDANGDPAHVISTEPGYIGSGGNGGFQAINLAIQFGVARIILLGFDMRANGHWHGRHIGGILTNPDDDNTAHWRGCLEASAPRIKALGVEVINCSRDTALDCFPKAAIEDVL